MLTVRSLAALLTVVLLACSGEAWAQDGPPNPPAAASVRAITGAPAQELLRLRPKQPLLLGERQGRAVAVLIAPTPAGIDELRRRLFRQRLDGCTRGGPVVCCERRTQVFWVWTDRGWADTGENCGRRVPDDGDAPAASVAPGPDGYGDDNGDETTIEFVRISHRLADALYRAAGIDYALTQLAEEDGGARVLMSEPYPTRADRPGPDDLDPETLLARIAFGDEPTVLASHRVKPGECGPAFNACQVQGRDQQCRKSGGHWFYRSGGDRWCRMITCCAPFCRC
jgi:hypothetical protein